MTAVPRFFIMTSSEMQLSELKGEDGDSRGSGCQSEPGAVGARCKSRLRKSLRSRTAESEYAVPLHRVMVSERRCARVPQ